MKKIFLLLGCIVLLCFVFSACDEAEESKADISKADTAVSQAVSETESEISEDVSEELSAEVNKTASVADIAKNTEEGYSGLETLYMDENYIYILGLYKPEEIIVTYTDGTTQNIKEAFEDKNVEIADLDKYEVKYIKQEKPKDGEPFVIADHRDLISFVRDATDVFYTDDKYEYFFGSQPEADCVIVVYPDGTFQNLKEAFENGNITIADLDRFEIEYNKMSKPA